MPGGVDGHRYIDLIGNFTSLVHGNAYPPIVEAVARQLSLGSQWPARNVHQVQLAELIVERVRSVQQVRFCNSGTEATMLAAIRPRAEGEIFNVGTGIETSVNALALAIGTLVQVHPRRVCRNGLRAGYRRHQQQYVRDA